MSGGGDEINQKSLAWISCEDWCYVDSNVSPRPAVVCNVWCGNSGVELNVNPPTNSCFAGWRRDVKTPAVGMTTPLPTATTVSHHQLPQQGFIIHQLMDDYLLQRVGWLLFFPKGSDWLRQDWLTWWLNKWELMDREWYVMRELTQTNLSMWGGSQCIWRYSTDSQPEGKIVLQLDMIWFF